MQKNPLQHQEKDSQQHQEVLLPLLLLGSQAAELQTLCVCWEVNAFIKTSPSLIRLRGGELAKFLYSLNYAHKYSTVESPENCLHICAIPKGKKKSFACK